jgi:putative hydrolase
MICEKDILADLHTHTTFSGHAYSTLSENITELNKFGNYKYIAITDHFYEGLNTLDKKNINCRLNYCKDRFNRFDLGISVINGCEFNIGQYTDEMKYLAKLDWKLVGLHNWFFDITKRKLKEVEEEIIFTLSLPNFRYSALAHIEREIHKVDNGKYGSELTDEIKVFLDNIVHFCKESNIYMEVNESSMIYNEGGATDRLVYWLKQAKDNGNMISLGTDAHSCYEVGRFDNVLCLLNEIDYPKDLIINCDNDKLLELKNN